MIRVACHLQKWYILARVTMPTSESKALLHAVGSKVINSRPLEFLDEVEVEKVIVGGLPRLYRESLVSGLDTVIDKAQVLKNKIEQA